MCTYCRQTDSTDRAADAKGVLFDQYSCTAILAAIEKCTSYSQLIKLLLRCGFDLGIANSDSNPRRTGGRYPSSQNLHLHPSAQRVYPSAQHLYSGSVCACVRAGIHSLACACAHVFSLFFTAH